MTHADRVLIGNRPHNRRFPVRSGMTRLLRQWGCECDATESIEEALTLAQTDPPDLIVSDYRLREQRTGAEAIATLRGALGSHLPAVLITDDTAPQRLREARAVGVPLLHKPVSPAQLYRGLLSVLKDSEGERTRHQLI